MYLDTTGSYRVIALEMEEAVRRAERHRMIAEQATFVPVEGRWNRLLSALGARRAAGAQSAPRTRAADVRGGCTDAPRTLGGA